MRGNVSIDPKAERCVLRPVACAREMTTDVKTISWRLQLISAMTTKSQLTAAKLRRPLCSTKWLYAHADKPNRAAYWSLRGR